jgi:crossover junction endodeoxyribonuclease RusA
MLTIFVTGTPAPQGSKAGYVRGGRAVLVESSKAVKPWRQDVVAAARAAAEATPEWVPPEAVTVHVDFLIRRPASVSERRRPLPSVKPDLDKLVRSTFDALTTSGVLNDDAQVCELVARKLYAEPGQPTGATIRLADALAWPA